MKKNILIVAVLLSVMFAFNKSAFSWGTTGGDGDRYTQLQETAVFFNNSGGILSAGDVIVMDLTGTNVSSGSTLGAYITSTGSADDITVVGVVKSRTSADQTPVAVVTKGPIDAYCQSLSGTLVEAGVAVGTFSTALTCDGGTNLGWALAGGRVQQDDKADGTRTWIWVAPTGAD